MADLSKIKLPSGTSYDLKDAVARADIETIKNSITSGMHYIGVTTTELSDGSTTNPITIDDKEVTAKSGDLVIHEKQEFIFSDTDNQWHEFGDTGSLKKLAFKDTASATYTPSGSITNTVVSSALDISASYTPAGKISTPTITVTPSTTTKYVASSTTGGGSVTAGSAAACTFPTFSTSVADETLTLSWTSGTFTANKPTSVTLPTFASQVITTGISSATASEPSFTGTAGTATGRVTPEVKVTSTFSGNSSTITVS